jgi:peptidoglycan L-alanyl-D-glutamate endopeptidase CwlK
MPSFSKKSLEKLSQCHPDLIRLFMEVIKYYDCSILEGHRSEILQNTYYESGKSKVKWPDGRHNTKPSEAVDVAPYPINWDDIEGFKNFGDLVKKIAEGLSIEIEWGGDWKNFKDYPHWQLKRKETENDSETETDSD